ncbi:MAG: alkaline phosphatase family protein [Marmoricola sp.]
MGNRDRRAWSRLTASVGCLALAAPGAALAVPASATTTDGVLETSTPPPAYAHVVVVVEENHSYSDIVGNNGQAPYLNSLADRGVSFTRSFAVTHPSQPNYIELFSGSTQGVTDDDCPQGPFHAPNLASELAASGRTFAGYSEDLPGDGSPVCDSGAYARKHAPWTDFADVPSSVGRTFARFPSDYNQLPTVSWVIPNLQHDMHDGTVAQADTWLRNNLGGYARWAATHDSLLVVTWDEDDHSENNQIPTILSGARLKPGRYAERVTHDRVLRTIEDMYGLSPIGNAASALPVTDVFTGPATNAPSQTPRGTNPGTSGGPDHRPTAAMCAGLGQALALMSLPGDLGEFLCATGWS